MRRVLVPLDGSELAERILPDARRVAGPDGTLIVVRDAGAIQYDPRTGKYSDRASNEAAVAYLQDIAARLGTHGVRVETHRLEMFDVAVAIDLAAKVYHADMVACATHGRRPVERLLRGSIAWRAVAHSPVPVLLHHVATVTDETAVVPSAPRIMVPLDGSKFAEAALPLAEELAKEWGATLLIVTVVPTLSPPVGFDCPSIPELFMEDMTYARSYLADLSRELSVEAHIAALPGSDVVGTLAQEARASQCTDIVLASHGHTGLSRMILGSVADGLIHHLSCPIIVIPGTLAGGDEPRARESANRPAVQDAAVH